MNRVLRVAFVVGALVILVASARRRPEALDPETERFLLLHRALTECGNEG